MGRMSCFLAQKIYLLPIYLGSVLMSININQSTTLMAPLLMPLWTDLTQIRSKWKSPVHTIWMNDHLWMSTFTYVNFDSTYILVHNHWAVCLAEIQIQYIFKFYTYDHFSHSFKGCLYYVSLPHWLQIKKITMNSYLHLYPPGLEWVDCGYHWHIPIISMNIMIPFLIIFICQ